MNIYELNKLIIQLESENNLTNNELIEFYKVKRIELIGQINSELKKNINKLFKEVKWSLNQMIKLKLMEIIKRSF